MGPELKSKVNRAGHSTITWTIWWIHHCSVLFFPSGKQKFQSRSTPCSASLTVIIVTRARTFHSWGFSFTLSVMLLIGSDLQNILQTTGSSSLKPAVVYFDLASKENQRSPFTRPGIDKGVILLKANTNNEALSQFFLRHSSEIMTECLFIPSEIRHQARNHGQSILFKNKICQVLQSEKTCESREIAQDEIAWFARDPPWGFTRLFIVARFVFWNVLLLIKLVTANLRLFSFKVKCAVINIKRLHRKNRRLVVCRLSSQLLIDVFFFFLSKPF